MNRWIPDSTSKETVVPIMVKVWSGAGSHRYRYINRSLPSLLRSQLPLGTRIILVDDQSTDSRLLALFRSITQADGRVEVWRNPERLGPNAGQAYNFPRLVDRFPDADFFVLCDDDIIYHPDWLQRLIQTYREGKERGVTGVFSGLNVPFRPAFDVQYLPTTDVLLKERQAALNWLLPRSVYEQVGPFRDTGIAYDTEYCNRLASHHLPIVCLRPSYVQNIGYYGAYQKSNLYTAKDFTGSKDCWLRAQDAAMAARRAAQSARSFVGSCLHRKLPIGS
jgi:glycosyltransferase involved in cell wall biosynthesis